MKRLLRAAGSIVALGLTFSGISCITQTTQSTKTDNTSTIATTATPSSSSGSSPSATPPPSAPSPTPAGITDANALPVTMPVLDAFFADESFATDLKTKLQLTDEQVSKLRTIAHEETGKLRETGTGNYTGTTAGARNLAAERIKAVIGEDKAKQLAALVRDRWSGTGEGGSNASATGTASATAARTPNAVPNDTRIVVNTPAYRMDVFEDGKLVKSYKIGIGYPEFPLPTGLRKARTIIFNPTWTPPDSPWVASMKNVRAGEKIEAGSKLNPLGPIKIPIGLPSLIHGGKSPAKLGGFASHGCVGLTSPQVQDFSKFLAQAGGIELSDADIAAYAKDKTETKEVKLSKTVPVELRYETIVAEDGKLHIYRDVYDHNTNTEANLRAVLEANGVTLDQLSEQERAQVMSALRLMSGSGSGKPGNVKPGVSSNLSEGNSSNKSPGGDSLNSNHGERGDAVRAGGKAPRAVKGQKEIVIEIAALKGKGYPAPVNLDTGVPKKQTPPATAKPGGKRRPGTPETHGEI